MKELIKAIRDEDFKKINNFLDKNIDLNFNDEWGETPLRIAVSTGNPGLVQLLIDKGAKVNFKNGINFTALHCAACSNFPEITKLLIENGAEIEPEGAIYPLHHAAKHNDIRSAEILIKNGACIDARTIDGSTPLHFAYYEGHDEMVNFLIKNNANQMLKNDYGKIPADLKK
jgi:ankyrin repeat protein